MSVITWVVRLATALVFAVAGLAKLADQPGARRTVIGFGLPRVVAPVIALVVSVLEIAVAVGLIFDSTAGAAAIGALLLLAVFLVGLATQLARGVTVPCACFGQIAVTPAGWPTVFRNTVLTAAAAFLVVRLA